MSVFTAAELAYLHTTIPGPASSRHMFQPVSSCR
jgi:hypothetical protein